MEKALKDEKIFADRLNKLTSNTIFGWVASLFNAIVIVIILWEEISKGRLFFWFSGIIGIGIVRMHFQNLYKNLEAVPDILRKWEHSFLLTLTISGLIWGSVSVFLFPVSSIIRQTFVAFVLGGLVAGSVGVFSVRLRAFLVFSIPALFPLIVRFYMINDTIHLSMGSLLLLFWFIMYMTARNLNKDILNYFLLKYENIDLISDLETEVEIRKTAETKLIAQNQEIERIVTARTSELQTANVKLTHEIEKKKHLENERIQLEAQLRQSQKMEAIGTLAGGIAHDFNNILSGIFGYSQLIEFNIDQPEKAKKYIRELEKAAQRAASLIRQILTFSMQSEYKMQPVNVATLVEEALQLLRSSIPANIEIKQNISSKAVITADSTQIHQVIMNLCTNAYHSMSDSGGVLTVGLHEITISEQESMPDLNVANGKYLTLEISDTGHGIEKKNLDKIFDPYYTTKSVGKGTGLGLAMVDGIVKNHKGFIQSHSEVGQGTTFTVFLPVIKQETSETIPKESKTGDDRSEDLPDP